MSDDELRRRLHEIPAPTARLDVDAAIAGARRTRRPKVAAMTAATAGAGILILAPFVMPGLSPLAPSGVVLSGEGADGGAPAAPESATETGESDSGAAGAPPGCDLPDASSVGLALRFLDDPADGSADLELASGLDALTTIELTGIGSADVGAAGETLAVGVDPQQSAAFEIAADATAVVAVDLAPRSPCAGDDASADVAVGTAPVATVRLPLPDGGWQELTVVGEPWGVR